MKEVATAVGAGPVEGGGRCRAATTMTMVCVIIMDRRDGHNGGRLTKEVATAVGVGPSFNSHHNDDMYHHCHHGGRWWPVVGEGQLKEGLGVQLP